MLTRWLSKLSLNNVRLRNKMLIVYVLSVFLPIVLTNIIFYNITSTNVKKQKMSDISLATEQVRNDTAALLDTIIGITAVLYNESLLHEYLDKQYESSADYVDNYNSYIVRTLEKYSPVYQAVQAITIYTDNKTVIYGGRVLPITDEVERRSWYPSILSSYTSGLVIEKDVEDYPGSANAIFSIIRRIGDSTTSPGTRMDPIKILKIDIHPGIIKQIFNNVTLEGDMYLLSGDRIMYTTNPDIDLNVTNSYADVTIPRQTMLVELPLSNQPALKDWKIVGAFQEHIVLQEVSKSKEFVLYLAIPNLVVSTLIIIWFTRSLSMRLVRILRHMKKVKNQNFDIIKGGENEHDEVGQLTAEFNRMTLQVKSLIDDVYVADIQKKSLELERRKTQLNALQSQINPHFLFNALETIRMRSLIKGETETAKIIANMAKIFRSSLTWNRDRVTVNEEMSFILCFLEIQKYRFEDRLDYEITIDPAAQSCLVPKMMFLPFVENACIHGVEPLKHGGKIDIRIERDDENLLFAILDNGVGMDEEKVQRFYSYLESEEAIGERIGVQNVIYRLKLIYGDRCRLLIDSAPGKGTYIRLQIPVE